MRSLELWTLAYLLNSLWQVPLVFAAAWLAARTMRRSGPTTEHRIWVAALALEAALPACPLRLDELLHRLAQFLISLFGLPPAGHFESITVITEFGTPHGIIPFSPRIFATIAIAYACTVLYFAGRLAWGILKTSALRRNSQPLTLSPNLEQSELAQCWSRCSRNPNHRRHPWLSRRRHRHRQHQPSNPTRPQTPLLDKTPRPAYAPACRANNSTTAIFAISSSGRWCRSCK